MGAYVAPSTGQAGWSLPPYRGVAPTGLYALSLALLAGWILPVDYLQSICSRIGTYACLLQAGLSRPPWVCT